MHAAADRPEFAPPPQPGLLRAFALAVLAHLLLILALTHGLHWKREMQDAAVEAELWSALPQEAAPKPEPVPVPPPPPPPVVKARPQPEPPPVKSQADIAQEREKEKRLLEQKRQAEQKRLAELEKQRERAKAEAQKKRDEELARKKELQQKQLAEARKKEDERKAKLQQQAAQDEKKRQAMHEENMKRMQGLAGNGAPNSTGSASQSSGPSKEWGARVVGRVRPNIVFTGERVSTWEAEVEIRLAPDGTIVSRHIKKSNAPAAWNEALLRALDKT